VSTTTAKTGPDKRIDTGKQTLCCNLKFKECGGQN
jgi:hypothetical protein